VVRVTLIVLVKVQAKMFNLSRGGMRRAAVIRRVARFAVAREARTNPLKIVSVVNDGNSFGILNVCVRASSTSAGNTVFSKHDDFSTRHIGPRESDRVAMLKQLDLQVRKYMSQW